MKSFSIKARLVSFWHRNIYPAEVFVEQGRIARIRPLFNVDDVPAVYLMPGFVDAHIHIESSMLVPAEFARLAVVHGTVATVSDPHEIANVCGIEGVDYMIESGNSVPFKFYFGAPSCVPATDFESAGARLDANAVRQLLERKEIKYLSEMMNFPGVLNGDEMVMEKIRAAAQLKKPVDGHAPGLRGDQALEYIRAGISTDHECFTAEEALDKLHFGMKVIIREGSAARNFDALIHLLNDFPTQIMFCSDDKHPDNLVEGHINSLCARAADKGIDIFKIIQAACINPVIHYNLDVGLLREGDPADFIIVENLTDFKIRQTWIGGELVADSGKELIGKRRSSIINNFTCDERTAGDFKVPSDVKLPVIGALDGQLITERLEESPAVSNGELISDTGRDILKIAVINRYNPAPVANAFIKNFGLKSGALASSVAHDSHNIVIVGADDKSMARAANLVIRHKGGVSCVNGSDEMILPLPVGGLMSDRDGYEVAEEYTRIDRMAKDAGCTLRSPFMTLSFMALLVIPHLKLSDKGLFDGNAFRLISSPGVHKPAT